LKKSEEKKPSSTAGTAKARKKEAKEVEGKPKKKASVAKQVFDFVEYGPKEIEEAIINLANSGYTPSQIGMILRDQYGVPSVTKVAGEKIEEILARHKLLGDTPRDLLNLIEKSVRLQKHLKENKKDFTAKRGYQLSVSKIRRLVNYYHRAGKLSKEWRYTPERAALLIK